MSVKSCEKLEKSIIALTVEVSAEDFAAAVNKAYLKMRKDIRMPGFRPGKAPRKMIENMYGAEVFFEEAINIAMPDAYTAALDGQELKVVGYPEIELVDAPKVGSGFVFKANIPVYPEVKLGQYMGLEAPKAAVEVTDDDVDTRLDGMAQRNTRLVSVERAVESGDTAVIDFEGFDNGVPFAGGKGESHPLEIGSGSFIPGFEEQIIGMKVGDEKDIDITFPEDYHADLAGKAVVFHVKVNEVKLKEVPTLDDEFAKDVSEFDSLEALKADLKEKITNEREEEAKRGFEEALMLQVAAGIEADVPTAMVEAQAERFLENLKNQLNSQNIPYDQYLQMVGMDEAKLKADAMEPSLRQVRMDLAITAIIETEKLEASAEEIEAEYKKFAVRYGMDVEMVQKYLPEDEIKGHVLNGKAVDMVRNSGVAIAEEKKSDEGDEKAPKKTAAKKPTKKAEESVEGEGKPAKKPAVKKAAKKTEE